ncbi:MAG TPA: hypothetical protein VFN37_07525 [Candidatus Baltobacteraceae bacterium]|nr:hypothetical protein [Candidatus Baltobacteraceae bacterium]
MNVRAAADAINGCKRVTLFCGVGCRESREAVFALAQHIGAPIVPPRTCSTKAIPTSWA